MLHRLQGAFAVEPIQAPGCGVSAAACGTSRDSTVTTLRAEHLAVLVTSIDHSRRWQCSAALSSKHAAWLTRLQRFDLGPLDHFGSKLRTWMW